MGAAEDFERETRESAKRMAQDPEMQTLSRQWFDRSIAHRYSYNFKWMGRPIIQYPQDILALQQLIWSVRPDVVIETGVAHGGSIVFSASMLQLLGGDGKVIGIDIDIRPHNRAAIEAHPMAPRIHLLQGSSISEEMIASVRALVRPEQRVLVILDSNHTHAHVLRELELYSPFVQKGSYLVVMDTVVEDLPPDSFGDRPWGHGDNPKTAVWDFLAKNPRFEVDQELENTLLLSVAPSGYLRCVADADQGSQTSQTASV